MPANSDTLSFGEDETITGNLLTNDTGAGTRTVTSVFGQPLVDGTVTVDLGFDRGVITVLEDGSYTFVPGSAWDSLAAGDTATITGFDYTILDSTDGPSNSTFTLSVSGTNDAPVVSIATGEGNEDSIISGAVPVAIDVDNGSSIASYQLTEAAPTGLTFNADGTWSFDASDYDSLAVGDTATIEVSYTATDDQGANSAPQTLTITINGVNDAPVSGGDATDSVGETGSITGQLPEATDPDTGAVLTYELAAGPAGFSLETDGSYAYEPNGYNSLADGDSGEVVIEYLVRDDQGVVTATHTLTITINGENDAPVVTAATGEGDEDSTITGTVPVATDVDAGSSIASYQLTEAAPAGLTFNEDGTWSFDGSGFDSLADGASDTLVVSYTATDDQGQVSAPQTLTITINGTNDAPVASAGTNSVNEDDSVSGSVSASDVDDTVVSYAVQGESPTGLTFNEDGTYSFDASSYDDLADGETQEVTFQFSATDEFGSESANQTVTITITGTNDAPVVSAATADVDEDDTFEGSVSATDADDGATLTYALTDEAPAGLTFNEDGTYSFDASAYDGLAVGDTATIEVSYTATDEEGATSDPATLTITVTGTNDVPVVSATTNSVTEGQSVSGNVPAATDADDGAAIASYQLTGVVPAGLTFNADGSYTFSTASYGTLAQGQTQDVVFSYTATDDQGAVSAPQTLTITITGIAGTSGNDTIYGTAGDDTLEGGAGSDNIYGGAGDDTFIGNADGVGDAYRGEAGSDTVDYSGATGAMNINLNNAASGGGVGTDQLYSIENVIASDYNDTISGSSVANRIEGGLGNDAINGNGGVDTVVINAAAVSGMAVQGSFNLTVTSADGVDVLRNVEFIQFDNALIQIDGVTGNAYAHGVADTAEADEDGEAATGNVLSNDIEIEGEAMSVSSAGVIEGAHGTLTILADGSYSYVATDQSLASREVVEDVFTYTVIDSAGQGSTATLTFSVMGTNDAPVAEDGSDSADEDETITGSVVATDVDGDELEYALVGEAPTGLTFNADGTYEFDASSYELNAGESEEVTFTYSASDGNDGTDTGTFTITINGVNDAPVADVATNSLNEDDSINGSVSASDIDGTVASYQLVGDAPEGLVFNADGTYSFDASSYDSVAAGDTLDVTVSFTATDDQGAVSEPQTLTITITGSNDAPVVSGTDFSIDEDDSVSGSVSGADVDGTVVSYALVGEGPTGLTFNADGTYDFDASSYDSLNEGDSQEVTFTFTGTDDSGGVSDPQTVTITINGVNDAPVADAATNSLNEDDTINGSVSASDEDGSIVSYQLVGEGAEGLTFNEDGTYSFDASSYDDLAEGDTLDVTVSFTATDDQGQVSEPQTLTITITGSNDAPEVSGMDFSIDEDDSVSGSVSGADVDGTVVSYELVGEGPTGLTFNADGTYDFDASSYDSLNEGDSQEVSFTFTGTDDSGGVSDPQTVTITINGVNDAPVADAATNSLNEDDTINGSVSASDEDGSIVSYQVVGEGPSGLTFNEDGTYTFDASNYDYLAQGDVLDVTVSFTATDDQGQVSEPQTLTITITGSNDAPVAEDDAVSVGDGDTYEGQVTASDEDGTIASYQLVGEGPSGLTFNADGSYSFDASAFDLQLGETEEVTFTFTATDDLGSTSEERTVTITVTGQPTQVTLDDGGDSYTGDGDDEDITGGDGDDVIFAGGGTNTVDGGEGDDSITAGSGDDTLAGGSGDDTITGGSGNDTLDGGEGDDNVNGGSGDDLIYSSGGADYLRGGSGVDTISFQNTAAGVAFSLAATGLQSTADGNDLYQGFENVIGTAFNDTLTGDSVANILEGGDGNDVLNGGGGADTMIGGAGNDTYHVDNAGDVVTEEEGAGTDRVITGLASYTLGANVENVFGQNASGQTLVGNDLANTMVGSTGADVLVGGLGGDTLIGGAGNDTLDGGSGAANTMQGGLGDDTYIVSATGDTVYELAGQGVDTVETAMASHTLRTNVENLTYTGSGDFTGLGNAGGNVLTGGAGNDTLTGGAGNDTLNGGDGVDTARYSGQAAGYSITEEGSGWRIIDTNLADGDDGSDFLEGIETLMFSGGVTQSLVSPEPIPLLSSQKGAGEFLVLPGLMDDGFLPMVSDESPFVLPALSDSGKWNEFEPLVLPSAEEAVLMPELFTGLYLSDGLGQGGVANPLQDASDDWWSL